MKTLVALASCLAVASAGFANFGVNGGANNNNGGLNAIGLSGNGGFGGGSLAAGASSGGYSGSGSARASGNGGYAGGDSSSRSGNGGYSGGGGGSGLNFNGGNGALRNGGGGLGGGNSFGGGFSSGGNGIGGGNSGFGNGGASGVGLGQQQGGQVRRFVSVHVAPELDVPTEPRIIRAGGDPDTHYNIIFVKAPSVKQQQTEVVLPEPPQQKTLVYVLVKKPENNADAVKIRQPSPTRPAKPEVFFIRYKPDADGGAGGDGVGVGGTGSDGGFNGDAPTGVRSGSNDLAGGSLDSSYGTPAQQNGGGVVGGYQ